jgi:signal transduction histidine kinase
VENLVSNAIKFVPPGVVPLVRIRAQRENGFVRLYVMDNGIGIKPQHHERIFEVFERLHGIEAYPGTGIGLAIVRKGIERLEGRVGLSSTPGQGSQFWIELHQVPHSDTEEASHLSHRMNDD